MNPADWFSIGFDLARGPDRTAIYFWRGDLSVSIDGAEMIRYSADEVVTLTPDVWKHIMVCRPPSRSHRCRRGRWWTK